MKRTALQAIALASLATSAFAQDDISMEKPADTNSESKSHSNITFGGFIDYYLKLYDNSKVHNTAVDERESDLGLRFSGHSGIFSSYAELLFEGYDETFNNPSDTGLRPTISIRGAVSAESNGLKVTIGRIDAPVYWGDDYRTDMGLMATPAEVSFTAGASLYYEDIVDFEPMHMDGITAGYTHKMGDTDHVGFALSFGRDANLLRSAGCTDNDPATACELTTEHHAPVYGLQADVAMADAEVKFVAGMRDNKISDGTSIKSITATNAEAVTDTLSLYGSVFYKGMKGLSVGSTVLSLTNKTNQKIRKDIKKLDLDDQAGNQEIEHTVLMFNPQFTIDTDIMEGALTEGQKAYLNLGYGMTTDEADQDGAGGYSATVSGIHAKVGFIQPNVFVDNDTMDFNVEFQNGMSDVEKVGNVTEAQAKDQEDTLKKYETLKVVAGVDYHVGHAKVEFEVVSKSRGKKEGGFAEDGVGDNDKSKLTSSVIVGYKF